MKPSQPARVYVICASERPLVAFEAISRREAKELCKEEWFREELLSLRSENLQIWNGEDALTARAAEPDEVLAFQKAQRAPGKKAADGILLAYLIPVNGAS
jgi:hypothetical protein